MARTTPENNCPNNPLLFVIPLLSFALDVALKLPMARALLCPSATSPRAPLPLAPESVRPWAALHLEPDHPIAQDKSQVDI
jgi:hypothetical protein